MKNVVIIGGGTGTFTLLSGLRKFPSNNSVVVPTSDDGGSYGILRKELGVMTTGDIRQCLVGLSYADAQVQKLFNFRFDKGSLKGHSSGNIILAALEKITGNVESAIEIAAKILNVRGQILPVTLVPTVLSAELANGKKIIGEHNIDDQKGAKAQSIKNLKLSAAKANPKVLKALREADAIVFGPGDLFTSVLPNLLVKGVTEAINNSKAKKIAVINIMTKFGQTDTFKASDFMKALQKYLGGKIDIVLLNTKKPAAKFISRYKKEKARLVVNDIENLKKLGLQILAKDLLSQNVFQKNGGDVLKRSFLRHDSDKTAKVIWDLIK
jgi:uncharacterized cofD-like protein